MPKYLLVAAFCVASIQGANAVPKGVCPTLAEGRWVIVSTHAVTDITAMDDDDARPYIGKEIAISGDRVAFDGRSCQGAKWHLVRETDPDLAPPGFPYYVDYVCPGNDDTVIPAISIGKSCDKAMFVRDGMGFVLHRKR